MLLKKLDHHALSYFLENAESYSPLSIEQALKNNQDLKDIESFFNIRVFENPKDFLIWYLDNKVTQELVNYLMNIDPKEFESFDNMEDYLIFKLPAITLSDGTTIFKY